MICTLAASPPGLVTRDPQVIVIAGLNDHGTGPPLRNGLNISHPDGRRVGSATGEDAFHREFAPTFATYLTETVGRQFNPPYTFKTEAHSFAQLTDMVAHEEADLVFGEASLFSCLESAEGLSAMATLRRLKLGAVNVPLLASFLPSFRLVSDNGRCSKAPGRCLTACMNAGAPLAHGAGVIFTLAGRHEIISLRDLSGKVISAVAPGSFLGMQVQWHEIKEAGLYLLLQAKKVRKDAHPPPPPNGQCTFDGGHTAHCCLVAVHLPTRRDSSRLGCPLPDR
jgi:hypothetical protein